MIYQEEKGSSNNDKQPAGGVILSSTLATSMLETIKNPIMFYGSVGSVVNQDGHTKDLWNYYWTAYSRGTDGGNYPFSIKLHNSYLDGYLSQRRKSIYDPCPFGFLVPSNGAWNQFTIQSTWTPYSYMAGTTWILNSRSSWFSALGFRNTKSAIFEYTGSYGAYSSSTAGTNNTEYMLLFIDGHAIYVNNHQYSRSESHSVRCIEESGYQSAPTDGRDPIGSGGFYTSKQNSDANGMRYKWGQKDPFLFATNSKQWGSVLDDKGMFPVKIYTIDGVLIYQKENGGDNKDKQPAGGVITLTTNATSMMETIKNPITVYTNPIISQVGHTRRLWDYYWTSYSRGSDGKTDNSYLNMNWHNNYLDEYTSQRMKSIFDPCPYGFKVSSNGTYNQFQNAGWTWISYTGGAIWGLEAKSFFSGFGLNNGSNYRYFGWILSYLTSTVSSDGNKYQILIYSDRAIQYNRQDNKLHGMSVRCIDFFVSPLRLTDEIHL